MKKTVISGYVAKSSYRDVPMYLSGIRWVDDIMKVKLGDLKTSPSEIKMERWAWMDKDYTHVKVTLTIEL